MSLLNKHKKPHELKLFLAKPSGARIAKLKHAYNKQLNFKYNESNELSFTLPYEFIKGHRRKKYKPTKQVKEKFLVQAIYGDLIQWFVIDTLSESSNDTDELNVQCYSLEHNLNYKRLIGYKATSYNCLMVTEEVLKGTGWKVGYINSEFNLDYREFDVSSSSRLAFLREVAETFEAIIKFDTVNKTVNFYKEDEISQYKGFTITERKYLEAIENAIDSKEIVTRLHIYGKDGLGIQSVNPTGQRYIDDFSYFLFPFEMDEKGNVIKHSTYMEDELAIALVNYNKYVSSRKDEFGDFLEDKTNKQEELTTEQNELTVLETDLKLILDRIEVNKRIGQSNTNDVKDRNAKNKVIKSQKSVVDGIKKEIESIDASIEQLGKDLNIEKHFSPILLEQLQDFIHEEEWTDEHKFDPNDLYESGMEHLSEVNSPPINMTIDIVNFFEVVREQHNWDKMGIGDIVRILHKQLNINLKARLTSIDLDFESDTINVTISNLKEINDISNKLKRGLYTIDKVNTDYNKRKIDYNRVAQNFNLRNDRIKEVPASPTIKSFTHKVNDNGSVNLVLNWDYPDHTKTEKNEHNIDGFWIYLYSDETNETYQFGSQMAEETMVPLIYSLRTHVFPSVPSNLYYTVGIRAYRHVDDDINADGYLASEIVRFNGEIIVEENTVQVDESTEPESPPLISGNSTSTISEPIEASTPETITTVVSGQPYQPMNYVNVNGRLNDTGYTSSPTPPDNPMLNDIWISTEDYTTRVWNGIKWSGDESATKEIKRIEEDINEAMERAENNIENAKQAIKDADVRIDNAYIDLDESQKAIDEAQRIIDSVTDTDTTTGFTVLKGTLVTDNIIAENAVITGTFTGSNAVFQSLTVRDGTIIDATIENATITGKLVSATGTFAGELEAASGTFTGQLNAATGSFVGEIVSGRPGFPNTIISNGKIEMFIHKDYDAAGAILDSGSMSFGSYFGGVYTESAKYTENQISAVGELVIASPKLRLTGGDVIEFANGSSIDNRDGIARWRRSNSDYIRQDVGGDVFFYGGGTLSQTFHRNGNITAQGSNLSFISGSSIDVSGDQARFRYSGQNYITVTSAGSVFFYANGVQKHGFYADGTKDAGSIEINGKSWGMSPIDSPRILISDMILDVQIVAGTNHEIKLNEKLVKAIANYGVFPSQPVRVRKELDSFYVSSDVDCTVDFMIFGTRIGEESRYWSEMDKTEDIV